MDWCTWKIVWNGSTNMCPDSISLGFNLTLLEIKVFCGSMYILWRYQIVEGKYRPWRIGKYNKLGEMVSLMLRVCRPIFGSGKAVFLDSRLSPPKGITYLEAKGFYVVDLINRWRYCPKLFFWGVYVYLLWR